MERKIGMLVALALIIAVLYFPVGVILALTKKYK